MRDRRKSKVNIPDDIDIHAEISPADFARITGTQRSTVSRNLATHTIITRGTGKIFLTNNLVYLSERFERELPFMNKDQQRRYLELIEKILKSRNESEAPAPAVTPAAPIKPYSIKNIAPEIFYSVGIFQDEEFYPLCKLFLAAKGEGVEVTPLEVDYIFQLTSRGQLENIFPDTEDAPALDLFCQEID